MDFGSMFEAFFDQDGDQSRKRRFYENERFVYTKLLFCKVCSTLQEIKIDQKTASETELIQKAFLMDFDSILKLILKAKGFKNRCQN